MGNLSPNGLANQDNKRVQFPRSTTEINDAYVGPPGQVVVDSNRNELRLQDGKRKGGWRIPNLEQLKKLFIPSDSEFGNTNFASGTKGFTARVSDQVYRLRNITVEDGLTIQNPDGSGGNPLIGLPDRLGEKFEAIADDCNTLTKSGRYVLLKAALNLPAGLIGVADSVVEVTSGHSAASGDMILQTAISLSTSSNTVYRRRFLAGAWTAWA
jgi:hypothetical protein